MGAEAGAELVSALERELGGLSFIAEDLGVITPDVTALRDRLRLPGARVLQFAFDGHTDNCYLPENYGANTVVYTGTHDNPQTRQWYEELRGDQRQNLWLRLTSSLGAEKDVTWGLIQLAWTSRAALAMAPPQDLLNLGTEGRMNVPGRADGNWAWRCTAEQFASLAFRFLSEPTTGSNRRAILLSLPAGWTHSRVVRNTSADKPAKFLPAFPIKRGEQARITSVN